MRSFDGFLDEIEIYETAVTMNHLYLLDMLFPVRHSTWLKISLRLRASYENNVKGQSRKR